MLCKRISIAPGPPHESRVRPNAMALSTFNAFSQPSKFEWLWQPVMEFDTYYVPCATWDPATTTRQHWRQPSELGKGYCFSCCCYYCCCTFLRAHPIKRVAKDCGKQLQKERNKKLKNVNLIGIWLKRRGSKWRWRLKVLYFEGNRSCWKCVKHTRLGGGDERCDRLCYCCCCYRMKKGFWHYLILYRKSTNRYNKINFKYWLSAGDLSWHTVLNGKLSQSSY